MQWRKLPRGRNPDPPAVRVDGGRIRYADFKEAGMKNVAGVLGKALLCAGLAIAVGNFSPARGQGGVPKYEVDPTWPKPLPGNMVTGRAGGICVDAQDHIFEVNRGDLQDKEKLVATPAP